MIDPSYQDHCNANYGPEDIEGMTMPDPYANGSEDYADSLNRQRAVVDGEPTELETRVAKDLWHRFGNPSVVEWENETHKAEYIDAAVAVLFMAHRAWRTPPSGIVISAGLGAGLPACAACGKQPHNDCTNPACSFR